MPGEQGPQAELREAPSSMEDATGQWAMEGIQHSLGEVTLLSSPWPLGHFLNIGAQLVVFMLKLGSIQPIPSSC